MKPRIYITASDNIEKGENNLVALRLSSGEVYESLEPRRLFPVNMSTRFITLLSEEGEVAVIKDLRDLLIRLARERDVAVFVSSHQLAELDLMCDRVAVLDSGKVLRVLTMEEIRNPGDKGEVELFVHIAPESAANIPEDCPLKLVEGKLVGRVNEDSVPAIIASLAAAGVLIMGVERRQRSLEDVFIELTRNSSIERPIWAPPVKIPSAENKEGGDAK